ncbi:hypothetical protein FEM48_Zijuj06G0003200 [Ziziphus jujuba var. spinosa]|uniref:NAD(P)-binding domain-containing protein n=1 Tax=Ziziphus jujuba var. spinosa TaxID=714518 RepID=A0A978V631_ZIZJJ|nr:hypothetical protein FEM48_Zijuj06G0003200 [Ziziphus jujuba var. spinosa]
MNEGVCVTGAGGFVGSWLVNLLLSNDYSVHGTVRNPQDTKNGALYELPKVSQNLKLFKADVLDYHSLGPAIAGCHGVFHTEMVVPAVKGTFNVLKACVEAKVKRVVVVSSVAAVIMNPNWPKGQVKDETCWSDKQYLKSIQKLKVWPWSLAKQMDLMLLTVCPSLVLGPILQSTPTSTALHFLSLLNVDVRDVAEALLMAYKKPEAEGRYICTSHSIWLDDLVGNFVEVEEELKLSSKKLLNLGWKYRPLEESIDDAFKSYEEKGIASIYLNLITFQVEVVETAVKVGMNPKWSAGQVLDETCWSDKDYCRTIKHWYSLSKTEAESEAMEFGEKSGLDVVAVCPSLVLRPILQTNVNASSLILLKLFKGGNDESETTLENTERRIVDVRDVAEAVVMAYEKTEAQGRYICTSHPIKTSHLVDKLRIIYPHPNFPNNFFDVEEDIRLSSEKLQRLGWSFRALDETLMDSVKSYQEAGLVD